MGKLENLTPQLVEELYKKHKTLTGVAEELNFSIETIRQFFIKNNIYYNKQIPKMLNHSFFSTKNEKSMYWAGFIAADGNVSKDKIPIIKISLGRKDTDHVKQFNADIDSNRAIIIAARYDKLCVEGGKVKHIYSEIPRFTTTAKIRSLQVAQDLYNMYKIGPAKSLIYNIPNDLYDHPLFNHFLRGLIDGDGWIYSDRLSVGLCGTLDCVRKVSKFLTQTLDLKSDGSPRAQRKIGRFDIKNLEDCQKIIKYLYTDATIYLDRKYKVAQEILMKPPIRMEIETNTLTKLYNNGNGQTIKELSKFFDCPYATIKRRLQELYIYKPVPVPKPVIDNGILLESFYAGKTINKLADQFNTTNKTIVRRLNKLGITVKGYGYYITNKK